MNNKTDDISDTVERRTLFGIITSVFLGGCLNQDDTEEGILIEKIVITNTLDESITVNMDISRNGETIHTGEYSLSQAEGATSASKEIQLEPQDEPGHYKASAVLVGYGVKSEFDSDVIRATEGNQCITLRMFVESGPDIGMAPDAKDSCDL